MQTARARAYLASSAGSATVSVGNSMTVRPRSASRARAERQPVVFGRVGRARTHGSSTSSGAFGSACSASAYGLSRRCSARASPTPPRGPRWRSSTSRTGVASSTDRSARLSAPPSADANTSSTRQRSASRRRSLDDVLRAGRLMPVGIVRSATPRARVRGEPRARRPCAPTRAPRPRPRRPPPRRRRRGRARRRRAGRARRAGRRRRRRGAPPALWRRWRRARSAELGVLQERVVAPHARVAELGDRAIAHAIALARAAALALVLQAALERAREDRAARAAVLARPRVAHLALRLVVGRVRRRVVGVRVLPLAPRARRTTTHREPLAKAGSKIGDLPELSQDEASCCCSRRGPRARRAFAARPLARRPRAPRAAPRGLGRRRGRGPPRRAVPRGYVRRGRVPRPVPRQLPLRLRRAALRAPRGRDRVAHDRRVGAAALRPRRRAHRWPVRRRRPRARRRARAARRRSRAARHRVLHVPVLVQRAARGPGRLRDRAVVRVGARARARALFALCGFAAFDGTRVGFAVSALTALGGPVIELAITGLTDLYAYSATDVAGLGGAIPSWIPSVYPAGRPSAGSRARGGRTSATSATKPGNCL